MYTKTGITRIIDRQGRVTLPVQFLKTLSIDNDDQVELYLDGNSIVIEPIKCRCIFCDAETKNTFYNKPVCLDCVASIGLK